MLPHYQFYALECPAMIFPINSSCWTENDWPFRGSELYLMHDRMGCFGSAINSEAKINLLQN